jgi:hypothetical protein
LKGKRHDETAAEEMNSSVVTKPCHDKGEREGKKGLTF